MLCREEDVIWHYVGTSISSRQKIVLLVVIEIESKS